MSALLTGVATVLGLALLAAGAVLAVLANEGRHRADDRARAALDALDPVDAALAEVEWLWPQKNVCPRAVSAAEGLTTNERKPR